MDSLLDRALGMLAGVAIGDAMGMPSEFLTDTQIHAWYGYIDSFVAPHPHHPHHRLPAGSVTDDTDHTLLLADLLLADGQIEPRRWAECLLAWSETPRVRENRFVGPSTLQSLKALHAGKRPDQIPRNGVTVGAAMRVAAFAIALPDQADLVEQVVASCALTHFTHNAISGAMAMAFALAETLKESADMDAVASAAQQGAVIGRGYGDWSWAPPIERRIEYISSWTQQYAKEEVLARMRDLIGVDLYPEQLVPNAIGLALLAQGNPQQAMVWAANLGGDTDTLASMTGSICGGLSGVNAFHKDLIVKVEAFNHLDLRATAEALIRERNRRLVELHS